MVNTNNNKKERNKKEKERRGAPRYLPAPVRACSCPFTFVRGRVACSCSWGGGLLGRGSSQSMFGRTFAAVLRVRARACSRCPFAAVSSTHTLVVRIAVGSRLVALVPRRARSCWNAVVSNKTRTKKLKKGGGEHAAAPVVPPCLPLSPFQCPVHLRRRSRVLVSVLGPRRSSSALGGPRRPRWSSSALGGPRRHSVVPVVPVGARWSSSVLVGTPRGQRPSRRFWWQSWVLVDPPTDPGARAEGGGAKHDNTSAGGCANAFRGPQRGIGGASSPINKNMSSTIVVPQG